MTFVLVGLVFALINLDFGFNSANVGSTVMIDMFPDLVGYLFLCFALDKKEANGRWFRESLSVASGLAVVSVVVLLSQIHFLFGSTVSNIDARVFSVFLSLATAAVGAVEYIIYGITMVFAALFSLAMMSEADKICHRPWSVTYTVFFVIYVILAVVYAVLNFIPLPFNIYLIALPVNLVFIAVFYISSNKLRVWER